MQGPKIEQPYPPRGDVFCWLHPDRTCTGDCEAFDPTALEDEQNKRTGCRLINGVEVMGKAMVVIAKKMPKPKQEPMPGADLRPPRAMG